MAIKTGLEIELERVQKIRGHYELSAISQNLSWESEESEWKQM